MWEFFVQHSSLDRPTYRRGSIVGATPRCPLIPFPNVGRCNWSSS